MVLISQAIQKNIWKFDKSKEVDVPIMYVVPIVHHNLVRVKKHPLQHDVVGALDDGIEFDKETSSAPLCS